MDQQSHTSTPAGPDSHSESVAPPRPAGRILIIRPSALGDVSRTVPALVTLRRAWPDARIDWLVQRGFADAIRHHPGLTRVIPFDRDWLAKLPRRQASLRGGLRFAKELKDTAYDAVYDLQGLFRSGLFTFFTRAPRRVGFANAREFGWLGYNVRHHVNGAPAPGSTSTSIPGGPRHTVDRMLALLEHDGLAPVRDMRLYTGTDDEQFVDQLQDAFRRDGFGPDYFCVAPTARWGCKCWPIERYRDVVERLRNRWPDRPVVVLAAPSEATQAARLSQRGVVFPQTTVGQMMAILRRTRLLVCNDSAPLHIAVGFDRPIVAIFGPTDPHEVGPYGRLDTVLRPADAEGFRFNYRAHRDDPSLIAKVTLDDVWRKIETTLANE